jgi:phosphopantothenoylcysteine decarboxylase/phosphopantothenate--cysteine ligase
MDGGMLNHPATQANLDILRERGAVIIGPEVGHLASGLEARGRMTEPAMLLGQIRYLLTRHGPLHGRRVVVTAGGTQEPIDPVRLLTNRSSGKQGYALAQAALDAGAEVTLISSPVALDVPPGAELIQAASADQMAAAVLNACSKADLLLMAAAVADYRPAWKATQKIKKDSGIPTLELEPTTDILLAVAKLKEESGHPQLVIGFAAETQDLVTNAAAKLKAKRLDLIVANDVSSPDSGFSVDNNQVTLLYPSGKHVPLPLMPKSDVADRIIAEAIKLLIH